MACYSITLALNPAHAAACVQAAASTTRAKSVMNDGMNFPDATGDEDFRTANRIPTTNQIPSIFR